MPSVTVGSRRQKPATRRPRPRRVAWMAGLALLAGLVSGAFLPARAALPPTGLFSRTNLVAWCIVPFDSQRRSPEARAAMLSELGIRRLAYDWRAEHIPTFDTEVAAMRRHGIELMAWWFPAGLNDEARAILDCIDRTGIRPQLWVTMGTEPEPDPVRLAAKLDAALATLAPVCTEAARRGCAVGLYNHLGWFGEPANQVALIRRLAAAGHTNVGAVYNLHHGHAHIDSFAAQLEILKPHLLAVNLNGMVRDGDRTGRKILSLGTGDEELRLLRILRSSGWNGPVGILGHTDEDAAVKLRKELAGLERLAPLAEPPPATAGEPAISGREPGTQKEQDWVDARWQAADVGDWLASNLPLPGGTVARSLTVRVGDDRSGSVAYDTATGSLRAWWTGGFLRFDPGRFGLIGPPRPAGTNLWETPTSPAWPGHTHRVRGWHRHGRRIVLEHAVDGVQVLESPWLLEGSTPIVRRSFQVAPCPHPLTLVVGGLIPLAQGIGSTAVTAGPERLAGRITSGSRHLEVRVDGIDAGLRTAEDGTLRMELPASDAVRRFDAYLWTGGGGNRREIDERIARAGREPGLPDLTRPASRSAAEPIRTRGQRGADTGILAVDTLTLPYDNPHRALLFCSGVGFTPDGAGYVSTIHGDVWRVTGVDETLDELTWNRFATGLFQPLGLQVRDGIVHVLGRDRITRLHDTDGDGEADFYESFFDGIATSTGGHDYVTALEQDAEGRLYYVDPAGVHRVAADGSRMDTLGTGFRNPNGMGVRPDGGVVTVAPQQGTWTPSSGIWEVRPGLYGGYGGPRTAEGRPAGYDAPLCWIPHAVDNSSGSQVWVPAGQWGPLGGQMLHLLWGRCSAMLVLRDTSGPLPQGAVVPLPVRFLSGPNRGVFHPRDGHLYVAGSTGWQTSAIKDGALQRVRFTGKPVRLPVAWKAHPGGLEITFSEPLDRSTAEDPGSYGLQQWNYRYSQAYGSADWSVADPAREGRDALEVRTARVGEDGRTVRLEVPGLGPAMQVEVKYNVDDADRRPMRGSIWLTLHGDVGR